MIEGTKYDIEASCCDSYGEVDSAFNLSDLDKFTSEQLLIVKKIANMAHEAGYAQAAFDAAEREE
jgi:hypothetical protein